MIQVTAADVVDDVVVVVDIVVVVDVCIVYVVAANVVITDVVISTVVCVGDVSVDRVRVGYGVVHYGYAIDIISVVVVVVDVNCATSSYV